VLSAVLASETREATKDSGSEGNRSERGNGGGSLSGLIVAVENRVTNRREPVSSEGDCRGEEHVIGPGIAEAFDKVIRRCAYRSEDEPWGKRKEASE
jgi:hypothetical protein